MAEGKVVSSFNLPQVSDQVAQEETTEELICG